MENDSSKTAPEGTAKRYETSDIYEGAYYMVKGCRFAGKRIIKGRKMMFTFEGSDLDKLVQEWQGGKPIVNAITNKTYIQQLKGMVAEFLAENEGKP